MRYIDTRLEAFLKMSELGSQALCQVFKLDDFKNNFSFSLF